ncbi:MAG TPA: hypothetical protein VEA99_21340 [Gemmatimonadaceae bacterium]|nr:hypothetical protein [Gemmatimonadaceae bacterium]
MRSEAARSAPRRFVDCVGTAWTVTEIRPILDVAAIGLFQPHPERRSGWLLFESDEGERRRLAPFPTEWRDISQFELERWCMRALRASPLENRRHGD